MLLDGKFIREGPTEINITYEKHSRHFKAEVSIERTCGAYRARLEGTA